MKPAPLFESMSEFVEYQKHIRRNGPKGGLLRIVDGSRCVSVPLTQGLSTLVSEEDYVKIGQYRWCAQWNGIAMVAKRRRNGKVVSMQRELLGFPVGLEVDHKNGDSLDNRRSNLRIATKAQNQRNTGLRRNNSSGYKGVYFHKQGQKWVATIQDGDRPKYLGFFQTAEEAATAYDVAALNKDPEFCRTNLQIRVEPPKEPSSESKG